MPVVCSEEFTPPLVEMLGHVTGRVNITSAIEVPGGLAGQVPQFRAGAGGRIGGQQVGQDPCPARPAGRVCSVTWIRRDQQRLGIGTISGSVLGAELGAEATMRARP